MHEHEKHVNYHFLTYGLATLLDCNSHISQC